MNTKPFINAILAEAYIVCLVLLMNFGPKGPDENTIIIPIAMLSLFVLSAAIMGYLFLSRPLELFLDGKRGEAMSFFMQTVATFAGITLLAFILWMTLFT